MKQVIIVRKDLEWGKGKLATHAAHAAVEAYRLADKSTIEKWEEQGAKKVVLKVADLKELKDVQKNLKEAGIKNVVIRDAGLTQLEPGTITALGTVPTDDKKIDKVTDKLKLL
ncbi:peptidyl-tRNA hydrolase [archaeon]|nr:MAG: peptidyl-tRNA hydrolase [archaeon]